MKYFIILLFSNEFFSLCRYYFISCDFCAQTISGTTVIIFFFISSFSYLTEKLKEICSRKYHLKTYKFSYVYHQKNMLHIVFM